MGILHLDAVVMAALLVGLRVGGLMLSAPFLSNPGIPLPQKAGLALALTALLYPLSGHLALAPGKVGWVEVAMAETGIGMLLGLAAQFVVEGAQVAGQLVGFQAGYSLVTLLDPQTQADTPVMSTFFEIIALLFFLQLGVDHWLLRALAASFTYLPAGAGLARLKTGASLLQAAGGIWLLGMQLAAPVVVATMVIDVGLAFLAKASPQMPILFVGLSVKTMLSLLVLAGGLLLWPQIFETRFAATVGLGERLLHEVR
ncbi:MAG: flagellar biosynthetic protein FliR [Terriglobales bacterium]